MADDRENQVRHRAYQIWEDEDRPSGRHEDHWHRAQSEIEAIAQAQAGPAEAAALASPIGDKSAAPKRKQTPRASGETRAAAPKSPRRRRQARDEPDKG